jgi:hypothetical protein
MVPYGTMLLFNTTRMVPGPPSTGVAIAMDGGMAVWYSTVRVYYTVQHRTRLAPAVSLTSAFGKLNLNC